MFQRIVFFLLVILYGISAYAQQGASDSVPAPRPGSHLRISLLTCGPGDEEVYEVFGHTAVRVIDSARQMDVVFSYGTFSYGPNFEIQFMRGKLLYYVDINGTNDFMQEYIAANRSMQEEELVVDDAQKQRILSFLKWNCLPANRYYKYDFFFDNCATRIRNIFSRPDVLGSGFQLGNTLSPGQNLTFRDIINKYFYRDHWTRVGVNILLGSRIDRVMTNSDIMFLPDYLRDGLKGATLDGKRVCTDPVTILTGGGVQKAGTNWPLIVCIAFALFTIAGLVFRPLRVLGRAMSGVLMLVTGLLGCLILVMWFATDHQGCGNNLNILWCLPFNIILLFINPWRKDRPVRSRYALLAMALIVVSLLLHVLKVQGLILEFIPLQLALLAVYATVYKNGKLKTTAHV